MPTTDPTTADYYADAVQAGLAWLDENSPDWLEVFVADRGAGLHMDDCDQCVLGHVLGSFWDARSPALANGGRPHYELWGKSDEDVIENWDLVMRASAPLGFCLRGGLEDVEDADEVGAEWLALGDAWRDAIEKRLADAGRLS